mgnify:CR=1 FL=1
MLLQTLRLLLLAPLVSARGWAVIFDAGSTGTRVHVYLRDASMLRDLGGLRCRFEEVGDHDGTRRSAAIDDGALVDCQRAAQCGGGDGAWGDSLRVPRR